VGIIEELSFTSVRSRLIASLLRLAEAGGARRFFAATAPSATMTLGLDDFDLTEQEG
jgi:hypothetical protein